MKSVRVVFLCWGYSIHAKRRIQIFIDDPRFEVTVVSTYNYGFVGAQNILLGKAGENAFAANTRKKALTRIPVSVRVFLRKMFNLFGIGFEIKKMMRDLNILRKTLAHVAPDIVFLQTLQYPSFLALLLPRNLRIVVTFWNGDLTHYAKWTGIEMIAKKWIVKSGLQRANAITVNSQTALDAAVSLGASTRKITLLRYPGVNLEQFFPRSKASARKRLGITASHVVLCPRGLGIFFNSHIIIEAASKVVRQYPDVLFLFISGVGGKDEWNRHLRQSSELGIEGRVRWDGQVPWEEMPWYYCSADVMLSILISDSCPNCMLESMACATPVVMSDTRQNREWIKNGTNGFLCPPHDASLVAEKICKIFNNEENFVSRYSQICLEKIRRDANSSDNAERIKDLVVQLAECKNSGAEHC